MNNKEIIKKRVQALLLKTTENGASESEAMAALSKAQQLMTEYYITENDLNDPFAFEKCIFYETPRIKSGYNLKGFLYNLSLVFDCEHFYTGDTVTFFGFEQDAELCAYFYSFIVNACIREKDNYLNGSEAQLLKSVFSGRTLAASFIRGFILGMSKKLEKMIEEREQILSEEQGLILVSKLDKVKKQYKDHNINPREAKYNNNIYATSAFLSGTYRADKTHLAKGVSGQPQKQMNYLK